jgi:hypothetical protein
VRRASSERSFNVRLLDLLLNYGCSLSACSLNDILSTTREDPFLLIEEMQRIRRIIFDRHKRQLEELEETFLQRQREAAKGGGKSPRDRGARGGDKLLRKPSLRASFADMPTPASIGLPEYSRVLPEYSRVLPGVHSKEADGIKQLLDSCAPTCPRTHTPAHTPTHLLTCPPPTHCRRCSFSSRGDPPSD